MITRRHFISQSSTAVMGGIVASAVAREATASPSDPNRVLKVGLVGCGGRGTGAASDALKADSRVQLTAMGDVFADRLNKSLETLRKAQPNKVAVTPENCFVGLDAYQKVIASGVDVVLLATPPGFRPEHLRAAVAAGKHVFCEKPVAVDAAGVRSVLATAEDAKRRNLSLVSGFCWRYNDGIREYMKRIHTGAIGEIRAIHSTYYTGSLTTKFPGTRQAEWTDLEWQLRNWYNFQWLSGDHLVEQAIHSLNKVAWAMKDEMPVRAVATGGRQIPAFGNIYDHFQINYEYANGARAFLGCRQQDNCHQETADYVMGTKGIYSAGKSPIPSITGETNWTFKGESRNHYQVEHDELFASIRAGTALNDGVMMANSTLMAIMGRMAAYTGQVVTWDQVMNSQESLLPPSLAWQMKLDVPPTAMPGKTKLV